MGKWDWMVLMCACSILRREESSSKLLEDLTRSDDEDVDGVIMKLSISSDGVVGDGRWRDDGGSGLKGCDDDNDDDGCSLRDDNDDGGSVVVVWSLVDLFESSAVIAAVMVAVVVAVMVVI